MQKNKINIILLIGALTSKPYSFNLRKWKLRTLETIDLFDSFGSCLRIDLEGSNIKRILPYLNNNNKWITDKARFSYDGIETWEFMQPSIKMFYSKYYIKKSWFKLIYWICKNFFLKLYEFNSFIIKSGNFSDLENISMFKNLTNINSNYKIKNLSIPYDFRHNYLFNLNLNKIYGTKIFIIIGSNLRFENPILNLKIKKLFLKTNIIISYIGASFDSTYNMFHLGNSITYLINIIEGKHLFCNFIKNYNIKKYNSLFINSISLIFGNHFLNKIDSNIFFNIIYNKSYNLNFDINIIHLFSGNINALELGFSNFSKKNINLKKKKNAFYLCEINILNSNIFIKKNYDFCIFQGFMNKKLLKKINIIFPTTNILEKYGLYINYKGIIQQTKLLFIPKKTKRENWKIFIIIKNILLNWKNFSIYINYLYLNKNLNIKILLLEKKIIYNYINDNILEYFLEYNNFQKKLIIRKNLYIQLQKYIPISKKKNLKRLKLYLNNNFNKNIKNLLYNTSFKISISDYYLTDLISSNSKIMKQCSKKFSIKNNYV